jgi:CHAT domain-containing protein
MGSKQLVLNPLLRILILTEFLFFTPIIKGEGLSFITDQDRIDRQESSMTRIARSIQKASNPIDRSRLQNLADSLYFSTEMDGKDSSEIADLYYYIGVCEFISNNYGKAVNWFQSAVKIKKELGVVDQNLGKSLFNLSVTFATIEDFEKVIIVMKQYLEYCPELYGKNSPEEAEAYTVLIGAYIQLKDFRAFLYNTFKALEIVAANKGGIEGYRLSYLYANIGSGYSRMGDFVKARIYLEEAEAVYRKFNMREDEHYINLSNNLGLVYGYLGLAEKEKAYFEIGTQLAVLNSSYSSFNLINSSAIRLAEDGDIEKGEKILLNLVEKAKGASKTDTKLLLNVLGNYALYLTEYSGKLPEALEIFSQCLVLLEENDGETISREKLLLSYSDALLKNGEPKLALSRIQEIIYSSAMVKTSSDIFINPPLDSLKPDRWVLRALQLKYRILKKMYSDSEDESILEAAAYTSEMVVSLIGKIRAGISEEESRILLGDRYRDSYLNVVDDFLQCYKNSGKQIFLEKTFEFAERSKAAGLLASTREMNAFQFHIPAQLGEQEISLQKEIGIYNAMISNENEKEQPDKDLLTFYNVKLINLLKSRDSLLLTFEKEFPSYYKIKYSNEVPSLKEVPGIIGRNTNYLNYIVSDSIIYIFLVNRKHMQVESIMIDTSFFGDLRYFRSLLSNPSPSVNARSRFKDFQEIGNRLYKTLIEPVSKYFISDNLIISTDNMLSYIPFETLLKSKYSGSEILYRELDYLMNNFNISYTYSVAFIEQMNSKKSFKTRDVIAFAPVYTRAFNIDSIFNKRQDIGVLNPLPFSQQEAEYVTDITGGKLYLRNEARESIFKKQAGEYNIIHLAMHTLINDQNPMNSALVFSQDNDLPEDGLLYTYEVYGIPLKSRLVVLSSCNTGFGKFSSGEGILSLARGFLYSGSKSVIMSMWEVEDKSGTEIIKMFYSNLTKGKRKSIALRDARVSYLKKAKQTESHPYFWSTLVVYGEDEAVYPKKNIVYISILCILVAVVFLVFYLRKRRYS